MIVPHIMQIGESEAAAGPAASSRPGSASARSEGVRSPQSLRLSSGKYITASFRIRKSGREVAIRTSGSVVIPAGGNADPR